MQSHLIALRKNLSMLFSKFICVPSTAPRIMPIYYSADLQQPYPSAFLRNHLILKITCMAFLSLTLLQILLKNQAKNSPKSHKLAQSYSLHHPDSFLTAELIFQSPMESSLAIHYLRSITEHFMGICQPILLIVS